jgi:hypothetical protein
MRRGFLVMFAALGVWLGCPDTAGAHRLDEYLQATRLSLDLDRVGVEIDLTAGVSLAAQTFASIDTDRDGRISVAEGEAYARQVLGSVVLSVDGRPTSLTLVDSRFPELIDMSLGVGTIRLRATAQASAAAIGRHQISYLNRHQPDASVYLVNALVPADPRIQIAGQRRDVAQRGLVLDYRVSPDRAWIRTWWLITGLAMVGVLVNARRPRRS